MLVNLENRFRELSETEDRQKALQLLQALEGSAIYPDLEAVFLSIFDCLWKPEDSQKPNREIAFSPGYGMGLTWFLSEEDLSHPIFIRLLRKCLTEDGIIHTIEPLRGILTIDWLGAKIEVVPVPNNPFYIECFDGNECLTLGSKPSSIW